MKTRTDNEVQSLLNVAIGLHESLMTRPASIDDSDWPFLLWADRYRDKLQGQTGIWDYIGHAAEVFEEQWQKHAESEPDYYLSLDDFAEAILQHEVMARPELEVLANLAIVDNIDEPIAEGQLVLGLTDAERRLIVDALGRDNPDPFTAKLAERLAQNLK